MFVKNHGHRERELFDDMLQALPEAKRQQALASLDYAFYQEVFRRIDETVFAVLYDGRRGRPNAPLNCLMAALVLRQLKNWTFAQLFENLDYHILTRLAVGLTGFAETPFCPATVFNFQNRLIAYERESGVNLFEAVFASLTAEQLRRFSVDGSIQRADSFLALSNLARYSRARLLIELLRRLWRELPEAERAGLEPLLRPYLAASSENYVYRLGEEALPGELASLTRVYAEVARQLGEKAAALPAAALFRRVLEEQFERDASGELQLRNPKQVPSGSLQSPDDPEATYTAKNGKAARGFKVNLVETAHPDNALNLIVDLSVQPNNISDGQMLAERLEPLQEQTPELVELHTDGGYDTEPLIGRLTEHPELKHICTGSRAGHGRVPMRYRPGPSPAHYFVACPQGQEVLSQPTNKRHKALFHGKLCAGCPLAPHCPAKGPGPDRNRSFYFDASWAETDIRSRRIEQIPPERRTLRANVEATVAAVHRNRKHTGKLRIRGLIPTRLQMFTNVIAVNFKRVAKQLQGQPAPAQTSSAASAARLQLLPDALRTSRQTLARLLPFFPEWRPQPAQPIMIAA